MEKHTPDLLKHPDVLRFIELVDGWNARVWGERLLWETLEGLRERPFPLLDPLSEEDMAVLRRLRDEHKCWPFWDVKRWDTVNISVWRHNAKEKTADDIRRKWDGGAA